MRRAARALALIPLLLPAACSERSGDAALGPQGPGNPGPAAARIVVVNSLGWTLSSLDPESGTMTARAADLGAAPNRVSLGPDGSTLMVACSGDNRVAILDARDLVPAVTIDVGRGSNPWLAVPVGSGTGLVTAFLSSEVRMLNVGGGTAGPPLATGTGPEGVAVAHGRAFVACTSYSAQAPEGYGPGRVDVVDLAAWKVIASLPVSRNPQDVAIDPAGRVHVLCTGTYAAGDPPDAGMVHVFDPVTLAPEGTVPLGGSPGRLATGADGVMWVAGFYGGLRRYDAATLTVLPDPADPGLQADGLSAVTWDPAAGVAWVTSFDLDLLVRVDGTSLAVTGAWLAGDGPVDVLVVRPEA
jgi:DNA-binding beta-propeller fold protein YncE